MTYGGQRYVLGIAGSTMESAAVLFTADGVLVSVARGASVSVQDLEDVTCFTSLSALLLRLKEGIDGPHQDWEHRLDAVCCSIEGVLDTHDAGFVEDLLDGTIVYPRERHVRVRVLPHRSQAAHLASLWGEPGIIIKAGTGAFAFGVDASGQSHRAGGWTQHADDDGGGFSIGRAALQRLFDVSDGRSQCATPFIGRLLERLECESHQEVVRRLSRIRRRDEFRRTVADIAQFVAEQADSAGDAEAVALLEHSAERLHGSFRAVVSRLNLAPQYPVALQGALLENSPALASRLSQRIRDDYPDADVRLALFRPVVGTVLEALRELGRYEVMANMRPRLEALRPRERDQSSDLDLLFITPRRQVLREVDRWRLPA